MKIIKEELRFEENFKKKLEFICEFSKVTPTFIDGSIRKIEKTNISYLLCPNYYNLSRMVYLMITITKLQIILREK